MAHYIVSFIVYTCAMSGLIALALFVYKKGSKCFHKGIFFKYIIQQLEAKYMKNDLINNFNNFNNEIEILINVNDKNINNKIYFLDNEYIENYEKKSYHDNLKELNELNTYLYIKK